MPAILPLTRIVQGENKNQVNICYCEKWDCQDSDCYRHQLTDQMVIGAVLTVLNTAIANPSLIENNSEISVYYHTADIIRKQNEISQMLDSAQPDFEF